MVIKNFTLEFFGASRQKILAPAGGSGVLAFDPHTRAARDQTAGVRQYGPPAQFSSKRSVVGLRPTKKWGILTFFGRFLPFWTRFGQFRGLPDQKGKKKCI